MSDDAPYYCQTCGLVRWSDRAPWCRHQDVQLVARRMVPLPAWHPIADDLKQGLR